VPPVTERSAAPSPNPLQEILVPIIVVNNAGGSVMTTESILTAPHESVSVIEYEPELIPVRSSVEAPFDQEKVYGEVPPECTRSIVPSVPPIQPTSVLVREEDNSLG